MGSRPNIRIRVLGPMRVDVDGSPGHLSGGRLSSLLAMLAINANRVVSRTALFEAVWPHLDDASNALGYSVNALRKRLGEPRSQGGDGWLHTEAPGYRLEATPDTLDALDFEGRLRLARSIDQPTKEALSAYTDALALWDDASGTAYQNVEHAEFCQLEIHRLRELWVSAVEEQISIELELGGEQEVLGRLAALTSQFPYRENLWKHHMTALYRSGQQTEALRVYRELEGILGESGLEPSEELQSHEERVLLHDPELKGQPPGGRVTPVPRGPRNLVGRDADVDTLTEWVKNRALVTVVGLGGVGKTSLAKEVARATAETFASAPVFVDLSTVADPRSVASALAAACGLRQHPGRPSIDLVVEFLTMHRRMVLLDNCEHLLPGLVTDIRHILGHVDDISILATSRVPIGLEGELVHTLHPLATSGDGPTPSVQLLMDAVGSTEGWVDPHQPEAGELVSRLGGIPLAIELAARHLGTVTIEQILRELQSEDPAQAGLGAADASTSAIRDACDWSFRALDDAERSLFLTLGLTTGGTGEELLRLLTYESADPKRPTVTLLEKLVTTGLIETRAHQIGERRTVRWAMLEPVRQFAVSCLSGDGTLRAAELDHARAAAKLAANEARAMMVDPTRVETIRAEEANFISATHRSLTAGSPEIAASVVCALDYYWVYAGRVREGRRWVERTCVAFPNLAATTADLPDAYLRASLLRTRGFLASIDGDYLAGVKPLERSIEVFDALALGGEGRGRRAAVRGSAWSRMHLARSLSASYFSRHGFDRNSSDRSAVERADALYRHAEADLATEGFTQDRAFVLPFLGWNAVIADIDEPEHWLEEARNVADEAHLAIPGGIARVNLAWFLLLEGTETSRVHTLLEEASKTFRDLGDLYSLQIALTVSAIARHASGDQEAAARNLVEALAVMALQGGQEWGHLTLGLAATLMASSRSDALEKVHGWLDARSPHWRTALASSGVALDAPEIPDTGSDAPSSMSESQIARLARAALLHPSG